MTTRALNFHYNDVIMSTIASQITSLTIVYSTVYSGADQRKHQNSASLTFVRGIHRGSGNSPHKGPVTRKMFPFDDVIMLTPRCDTQNKNFRYPLPKWYAISIASTINTDICINVYVLQNVNTDNDISVIFFYINIKNRGERNAC